MGGDQELGTGPALRELINSLDGAPRKDVIADPSGYRKICGRVYLPSLTP